VDFHPDSLGKPVFTVSASLSSAIEEVLVIRVFYPEFAALSKNLVCFFNYFSANHAL
jgi:hypothetical protein